MSLELKMLLKELDTPDELIEGLIKGDKTGEDFKKFHQETFVAKQIAMDDPEIKNKIIGKITGSITTKLKSLASLDKKEIEGKQVEEIAEMAIAKFKSKITELEELSKKNSDETVKSLQSEVESWKKKTKDFESLATTNFEGWEGEKKAKTETIKSFKLNHILSQAKSKIPLKDGITDLEKAGFESLLKNNYVIDLGDNDEPEIYTTKGERVKSESGNKFVTLEDLLLLEAKKNNILKQQPTQGARKVFPLPGSQSTGVNGLEKKSWIHPNAIKR